MLRLITSSNLVDCTTGKSRLRALKDTPGKDAEKTKCVRSDGSVAYQAADFGIVAAGKDRRNRVARRQD